MQHRRANAVLAPPAGMSAEECHALAITRIVYGDGTPAVVSHWLPTAEQLALLAAGKPVWLSVLGHTHPPLVIGVEGDGRLEL